MPPRAPRSSNRAIRAHLRRRQITTVIPEPADQIRHLHARGRNSGRPPTFDTEAYKQRNTVERAFNRLKACRSVALRTGKRDYVYRGTIDTAPSVPCANALAEVSPIHPSPAGGTDQ